MQAKTVLLLAFAQFAVTSAAVPMFAQTGAKQYPAMAPLNQYLMPEDAEIALARTAAPKAISDKADVMVLKRDGYVTAAKGTNGFLCIVERSWANSSGSPEFWNPKLRSPNCFNAPAARTFVQIYLMKTRLVLEGKSKTQVAQATASALDSKELTPLAPNSMCYMMSKEQYLNDEGKAWHPHLMFFVSGDAPAKNWGADLPGSPIIAASDPEERVTILMVVLGHWSDGTPAAAMEG
ncbi:MAG TPA: hypothetical protein VHY48_05050 [Acidobacteriaceae bacterium]|nr:hypothetical protein [Acidobacteriaceae bacterium]